MKLVAIAMRGLCVGVLCWSAVGCANPSGHHRTELEAGPNGLRVSAETTPKEKTLKVHLSPGYCSCVTQHDANGQQIGSPTNLASPGGSVALAGNARYAVIVPYKCDDASAKNACTQAAARAASGTSSVGGPTAQSLARRALWMHALPDDAGRAQWLSVLASGADPVVTNQLLELLKSGPGAACPPNLEIEFWANASPQGLELCETEPLVDLPVALNGHPLALATTFDGQWFRSTCVFPSEQIDFGVPGLNELVIPYEPLGKERVEYRIEHAEE